MGLVASLSDFTASEIFFLLTRFDKTGRIELRSDREKGEVYFSKGKVVHASYRKIKGVEALYHLSIFVNGQIEFYPNEKTTESTIKDEVSKLIGEIERRRVEVSNLKAKLPPFDTILVKSSNPPEDAVALRKDDWKLLILMDGKNDITQVIEKSGMGALEVYKTVAWFLEKNLICDPKEIERTTRERVKFLNILFIELSTLGVAEKEWIDVVKTTMDKTEVGKVISANIIFRDSTLSAKKDMKIDSSRSEIEGVFSEAIKILEGKCKNEFGPMLTKTKFAVAVKKLNETRK